MREAGRRFKAQEREKIQVDKKAWGKRKGIQKKKLIYHLKVIYINAVFEDFFSSKSAYILLWFCVASVNEDET